MIFMSFAVAVSTVAAVYAASSFIFLRKPQWIHRKRRPAFLARNIGHRGGEVNVNDAFHLVVRVRLFVQVPENQSRILYSHSTSKDR
jgi:hypothetical protein